MFSLATKEVVKYIDSQGDPVLINNNRQHENYEMLTLFKGRQWRFFQSRRYRPLDRTLLWLTEDNGFSPGYNEAPVAQRLYRNLSSSGGGGAGAPVDGVVEVQVKAGAGSERRMSPATLIKQEVDMNSLMDRFNKREIRKDKVDDLDLKDGDILAFVKLRLYNQEPVELQTGDVKGGSVSALVKKIGSVFMKGNRTEEIGNILPEKTLLAYALKEITIKEGVLGFSMFPYAPHVGMFNKTLAMSTVEPFNNKAFGDRQRKDKTSLLKPLAELPDSARRDLRTNLRELLQDRAALTLLERTLDQDTGRGKADDPQSQAVSAFMDLLSKHPKVLWSPAHLLVSAMDMLPDGVPALLMDCGPDMLKTLNQMVDDLMTRKAQDPEPLPLQEEEELCWVVELLTLSTAKMKQLSANWDRPELPVEDLLVALCVVVRGLSLLQP